ncbi:MAG: hypothetical protein HZA18_07170 [Nitrospirae bacterium]|nr:hypothetical protein [Nitrospirota bacterium]
MKRGTLSLINSIFIIVFSSSLSFAGGNDINLQAMAQSEFEDLSKEVGLIVSYVPLAPAEPLGVLGFDIGIEVTEARISSGATFWEKAVADGKPPDYVVLPKIHVQKGLPFGIDLGAIYAMAPGTNISLYGGELKWAFMKGSIVSPAAAIRGSYTALAGVNDLDATTYGLDASISKGFGPLTPYAGLGNVWIKTKENAGLGLNDVSTSATKLFIGAKFKILLLGIVLQADFSDTQMYSARANISF